MIEPVKAEDEDAADGGVARKVSSIRKTILSDTFHPQGTVRCP